MNSRKKLRTKSTVLLLLLLSLGLNSCKKSIEASTNTNTAVKEGAAKVIVNMLGIDETGAPLVATTKGVASGKLASVNEKTSQVAPSEEIQETVVPFSKDISVVATLVPQGNPVPLKVGAKGLNNRIASTQAGVAPATQTTPLATDIMYVVAVFNDAGNLVGSKRYIRGKEVNAIGGSDFVLDAGKTYTFVATSYNSTAVDPSEPSPGTTLASAVFDLPTSGLVVSNGGPMYFRRTMTLTEGVNNLDIVLKHQLSEITTTVTLDPSISDNIQFIGGGMITPGYSLASLKLADGVITYSGSASGTQVSFNSILPPGGVRSITSSPTIIATPATTTGVLTISSITIGGAMKTNLSFPNLNITPGVKYNLNLTFRRSLCTQDVNGSTFNINIPIGYTGPNPILRSYIIGPSDYGFVMDLSQLDNSFSLEISSVPLFTNDAGTDHEIEFDGSGQNIEFADGSGSYGSPGIGAINTIIGTITPPTVPIPILRVMISSTGAVSMYGSKVSNGTLFPLKPKTGWSFNTVPWITVTGGAKNVVNVSQKFNGVTVIKGRVSGKSIIGCPLP